jgi:SMODS-associated and fused to various effectors sensor domain
MSLPPRAAAIRGDDYQHAVGWYWACQALDDPDITSVSVEDAAGGHFDDVVVRHRQGPDLYWQVKSSNYGSVVVDETWLVSPVTRTGRSPLQHFHATWRQLRAAAKPFELTLLTNRGFDPADAILRLRDLKTEKLHIATLTAAGPRSAAGRERQRWASHLGIDPGELADFLLSLSWKSGPAESSWDQQAQHLMRLAGLRSDDDAVTLGKAIVRSWVTDGAGPMSRDDIRRAVARAGLLARNGTLVLAVHAIDRQPTSTPPNVEIDLVDLYDGADAFARVQLRDPAHWNTKVEPAIRNAARELEAYATRRVHVTGSMRLPHWFAVGRALPDVRGWVLSVDQRTQEWSTDATPEAVTARVLAKTHIGNGPDLAILISITHDISEDVAHYISVTRLPVSTLLAFGPQGEPGNRAVTSAGWATAWVRSAREQARRAAASAGATRAHLYMAAPAALAMMLGHQWNLMPSTTIYEHIRTGYAPTFTFP